MESGFESIDSLNLTGDDIQKLSVIQNLPQLLQTEPNQTYSRIIPKILQELPNSSCEFHVMTSKAFKILMEKQVSSNLFHAVLQGIELKDPIASNAWMETLIAIIPVLNVEQLKTQIVPLANNKALLSQPLISRIASCKILGKIAVHTAFDTMDVKRDVLPLAQSLCQDCHPEVRTVMCSQLPYVAQGLGDGLIKGNLLASLVELGSDDNMYVRAASVSAIVQIFPYTSLDVKKATLLPLIKQLCDRSMKHDDLTAATLAKEIGKIVDGLQYALTIPEMLWFLNYYKKLAVKGLMSDGDDFMSVDASMDVTCRQQAAANLPAMSAFTISLVPSQIELLYMIFRDLAADPCYIVRRTVAGCIYDVIKVFGADSKILKADFVRLLQDDSEEVLHTLVPHLGNALELLCQFGTLSRLAANPSTMEIGRAILKCQYELASGNNWRLLTHFVHQLEHLPNCMPPDFIHQHFTPIVLTCAVEGRARPVRVQAVRTLLIFLRYNGKEMQRRWLRENLVAQLCHSDSYYTRLIYIRLCANAIDIFSDKYFKEYFYEHLLALADDPIPNIRLCVVNLFAFLKQMLVLPEDKLLYEKLNDIIKKCTYEEKDRDVLEVFQLRMKEIKNAYIDKEEYKREQKRRRDEEDQINVGAKAAVPIIPKRGHSSLGIVVNKKSSITSNTMTLKLQSSELPNSRSSVRSASVPPKLSNSQSPTNDMSFLEQHFYIDAGVNLPSKTIHAPAVGKTTVSFLNKDNSNTKPENCSYNITDDDKVNLRKLPNINSSVDESTVQRISKRHSSVISETCLMKVQEKALNRRSLNLPLKTLSRIPISNKGNKAKIKSQTNNANDDSCQIPDSTIAVVLPTITMTSQLPVLKSRNSLTDRRK